MFVMKAVSHGRDAYHLPQASAPLILRGLRGLETRAIPAGVRLFRYEQFDFALTLQYAYIGSFVLIQIC